MLEGITPITVLPVNEFPHSHFFGDIVFLDIPGIVAEAESEFP